MSIGKKIILAGVTTEILFLLLLGFYGNLFWRAVFILAICSVFLGALALFKKGEVSERALFVFGFIFVLTCLFFPPRGSADINNYAMMGRIAGVYQANPYVTTPDNFSADVFYERIGEVWRTLPLTYGPFWLFTAVPISVVAGTNFFASAVLFKLLAIAFGAGCVFLLSLILDITAPGFKKVGVFLLAWNPWLIFEVANNGHNDIMVAFFILLAVYFTVKNKKMWVLPALVLAVLVKYVAVILLPIFVLWMITSEKNKLRPVFWLKTTGVCLLFFIVCYFLFWQGLETFRGLVVQGKLFGQPFFYPAKVLYNVLGEDILLVVRNISYGVFFIFYALIILMRRRLDTELAVVKMLLVIAVFLVFGLSYFQPWYLIWLAPLFIIVFSKQSSKLAPWLTLAGFLFYIFY